MITPDAIPPRRRRGHRTGTPTYIASEDQTTYPPEPVWATDERGRFHYTDYDGESLLVRHDMNGDLWVDKQGEGPVYIRKEHIALILEAIKGSA